MRKILTICAVIIALGFIPFQSKKEVKKHNIKSVTVTVSANGKTINEEKTVFYKNGEIAEEINYTKEGLLKSSVIYKRNKDGNVIEEKEFDSKNQLVERKEIKYNNLDEKFIEYIYNNENKLEKKSIYTYNKKGLKTEKTIYDAANNIISIKKYTYEYN